MKRTSYPMISLERFFISGCQRSGTTMLRLVLESHPAIHCFDEGMGYDFLVRETAGENIQLPRKDASVLHGFKIPRFAEQLVRPVFNDPDYGTFPSFYNDQKVIHIFRDGLDVIGSMIKLQTEGGISWLDKYGRSILKSMIARQCVSSPYRKKYEEIERLGFPAHLLGALYWEIKNQGFFDLLKHEKPVYPIRYESVVTSPREELLKLSRFLEVDWDDALLNHPAHPHSELDENGKAIGETDPHRCIDTCSVGGHRRLLTKEQISEVENFIEDTSSQIESTFKS